jgi:hypothetical protein
MICSCASQTRSVRQFTLSLTLFGVDKATAAGFSIVVFLALTLPLWIIGFIALTVSGMNLKRVRLEISGLKTAKNS